MAHPSVYERQSSHPYQQSLQMPDTYVPLSAVPNMSVSNKKPKLSRLELMKQNYEKKRQKDVEEKLTELRAQQARADSGKSHSGGTVRAFFAERRAMEASKRGQQDPSSLPPIGVHFKKMKSNQGPVVLRASQKKENKPINPVESIHTTQVPSTGNRGMVKYHRKKSKGIDKQNPLPPLQKGASNFGNHKPPTPNRRYETHDTLRSEGMAEEAVGLNMNFKEKNVVPERNMVHVPHPPKKPKNSRVNKRPAKPLLFEDSEERTEAEENDGWSVYSEDPPPNLAKVKALRMKRLSQRKLSVENSKPEKPTEFQKWQMKQDKEREERLENYRKRNQQGDKSDEQEVTLSMRERELLEKIKAEQEKLSAIKKMQQELEEQEKFERENTSTSEIKVTSKRERELKEDNYDHQVQKRVENTPTPVKKVSPIPQEVPERMEMPKQLPKKVKSKPKPQIIQQETEEQDEEPKDNFVSFYEQAGKEADQVNLDLSPCSICGRNFATDRLSKHEVVCLKNANKKRKKFDVQKQRVAGMEHESFVLSGKHKEETPKAKKLDWRVQHENFIKTIRYAKGASNEPPPVTENPHYIACPYCERKFNPETAERHIPRCKDIKARPAPPKTDRQRRKR